MTPLSADDRQALRRADMLIPRVMHTSSGVRGWLEMVSEHGADTPARTRLFPVTDPDRTANDDERRRVVPVRASLSRASGPPGPDEAPAGWVACMLLHRRAQLAGIVRLVGPGEGLVLRVLIGNSAPLVDRAGLVTDTLTFGALGTAGRTHAEIGFDVVRRDDTARVARPVGSAVHGTWAFDADAYAAQLDELAATQASTVRAHAPAP